MRFVAIRIAEARLIVADDRVVPIRDVERAVGAELRIHRTEAAAGGLEERRQIFQRKTRTVVFDPQRPDGIVDVATRDERALPCVGKVRRAHDVAVAALATVAVFPNLRGRFVAMVHHHSGHGIDVRTVVARDDNRLAPMVEDPAPRILRLVRGTVEAIKFEQAWTQPPQPGLFERGEAPRRLNVRVDVQALAHEQLAAVTPHEGVDVLMIVAGAEPTQHHAPLVRLAVTIVVLEEQQFGAVTDIRSIARDFEAGGNHQPIGEHGRLVGTPVVIRVLQNKHLVVGLLARFDERINRAADNPQTAPRVEADLNRLHHAVGLAGKKIHLETGSKLEGGEFVCR